MFPKHNHKNQILKNVSKTQTQRPNFQTFFQNKDTKIKLSNMFPKHKHNDQIIKHVSKTQTQRSNYQTCVQNKNTDQISQTQRLNYQTCDGECPKHSRANSFWKKNST